MFSKLRNEIRLVCYDHGKFLSQLEFLMETNVIRDMGLEALTLGPGDLDVK